MRCVCVYTPTHDKENLAFPISKEIFGPSLQVLKVLSQPGVLPSNFLPVASQLQHWSGTLQYPPETNMLNPVFTTFILYHSYIFCRSGDLYHDSMANQMSSIPW